MASFDLVNYSLRPSKSIQRQIVFDGIRGIRTSLTLDEMVYIGLGSVWFTDFVMAHELLEIKDMVSMEKHDIGYSRARFNVPYATVQVRHGSVSEVMPSLYDDDSLMARPWVIWLDYDQEFDENLRAEVRTLVERAPADSVVLITIEGKESEYGKEPDERISRLRQLFGDIVPDDLSKDACRGGKTPDTLANYLLDFFGAAAAAVARPGEFVPAFRIIYRDTATMITVGGVLAGQKKAAAARARVEGAEWRCQPASRIVAPHLTIREALALRAKLPTVGGLSRKMVNEVGFDLADEQIKVFETYYKEYPAYAEVLA